MTIVNPSILITTSGEEIERLTEIRDKLIIGPATQLTLLEVSARLQALITELELKADLTETQPVSGTIAVNNFPATQPVVGTVAVDNFPANQPVSGTVAVNNFPVTQPVSGTVTVSNLPADTATATHQTTQIARLETIRDRTPTLGPNTAANATPVVLSSDGPFASNFGLRADPAAIDDVGSFTLIGFIKRLLSIKLPSALSSDRFKVENRPLALATDEVRSLSRNLRQRWRDDFAGTALDSTSWTVVQTGVGHTISVASSELRIATGVTANTQTTIRSTRSFRIPFRLFAIASLSQRIANQEFYIEVVDASGGHYASFLFDGTSTSAYKSLTGNSGNATSPTAVSASVVGYLVFEMELSSDETNFYHRSSDSNAIRASGGARNRQIPDPNLEYFIQIRARNLATAPASSTNFVFDSISVQDLDQLSAEITGGRGGGNFNQTIPISGNIGGTVAVLENQATNTDFGSPLAANAALTGANRDANQRNTVRGWVFTDQNGTLYVEQSVDNSTFRQTHSFTITGSTVQATIFEFKMYTRYYRLRYVNGGVAQATLQIISTTYAIGA